MQISNRICKLNHGLYVRKVKRELIAEISESSWAGAILSILTTVVVVWLIYSELTNYLQVSTVSRLAFDQNEKSSDTLQVHRLVSVTLNLPSTRLKLTNAELQKIMMCCVFQMIFNVDFPKLNCEHLHIHATNFMGTRKAGLSTKVSTLRTFM
jgi:uncharacterized membrane protein YqjE